MAAPLLPGADQNDGILQGKPQAFMHDPGYQLIDVHNAAEINGSVGDLGPCTIAVIGAGVTGLEASKLLAETGANVTLYEAANKVGGRLESVGRFQNGAMRVGPSSAVTMARMKDYRSGMRPGFPNPGKVDTYIDYKGEVTLWKAGTEVPAQFANVNKAFKAFVSSDISIKAGGRLVALTKIRTLLGARDKASVKLATACIQQWSKLFSNEDCYGMLRRIFMSDEFIAPDNITLGQDDLRLIGDMGFGTGPADQVFKRGATQLISIILNGHEEDQGSFVVIDNEGDLIDTPISVFGEHLATAAREKGVNILLNHRVTAMRTNGKGGYLVEADNQWRTYDYVIACAPTNILLNEIEGLPDLLGHSTVTDLRTVDMLNSNKVFFNISNDLFKELPDFPRCIVTNEETKASFFIEGPESYALGSYVWGEDANNQNKYGGDNGKVEMVLATIRNIIERSDHREAAKYFTRERISGAVVKVWGDDQYTKGGFALEWPGQGPARQRLLYHPTAVTNKLYIGGADLSRDAGWIEPCFIMAYMIAVEIVRKHGKINTHVDAAAAWDGKIINWE